jgi:hypothetical protein
MIKFIAIFPPAVRAERIRRGSCAFPISARPSPPDDARIGVKVGAGSLLCFCTWNNSAPAHRRLSISEPVQSGCSRSFAVEPIVAAVRDTSELESVVAALGREQNGA